MVHHKKERKYDYTLERCKKLIFPHIMIIFKKMQTVLIMKAELCETKYYSFLYVNLKPFTKTNKRNISQ